MGIFSLPGTKGAAQYAVDKSAKALAKAEEGAQGVGDFFGNVSSHMFGGAMMGGVGNTALYANAGDGYNGVQGYGQAFFSGATAGAIAGGALGAYRGVGRATASDAKIARLQAKHEKNLAVLARRSGGGGGGRGRGVSPLMKQFNDPTMKARDLIRGDRDAARGGSKKTSTATPAMNPVNTAPASTPTVAQATPKAVPAQGNNGWKQHIKNSYSAAAANRMESHASKEQVAQQARQARNGKYGEAASIWGQNVRAVANATDAKYGVAAARRSAGYGWHGKKKMVQESVIKV